MNNKNIFLLAFLLSVSVTEAKTKQTTSQGEEVVIPQAIQAIHDLGRSIERFAKILEKLSQQLEDGIIITHRHCE